MTHARLIRESGFKSYYLLNCHMWNYLMGNPDTLRCKILKVLNKYRVLSYRDLLRESHTDGWYLTNNLKNLIEERIVIRWDFNGYHILYSHCFIPWYEVKEIYQKKYTANSRNRSNTKKKLRRDLEKILK